MGLISVLPKSLHPYLSSDFEKNLEEIRIRVGQEAEFIYSDYREVRLKKINEDELTEMLNYLSDYSPYMLEEELRQGFFTIKGGHRVGVAGHTRRSENDGIKRMVDIGALNVRVAHEVLDCAYPLYSYLWENGLQNLCIVASPGMGKTTLLRDLIRLLSTGDKTHAGVKVGVVDERSEIAACYCGIPQNNLGPRVDVLDNCPKYRGMQMLLRSMSPQVIAVDELGAKEEFAAVQEIVYSGCLLIATIHASSVEELYEKPYMKELMDEGYLNCFAKISRDNKGKRRVTIMDKRQKRIC